MYRIPAGELHIDFLPQFVNVEMSIYLSILRVQRDITVKP